MKSILISILMVVAVLSGISSCATVPTGPLAAGEVRLLGMDVSGSIRMGHLFVLNINFETDDKPEIRTACFYWSGEGPYCFKVMAVKYGSPGTIKVEPRARDSGWYMMESYVLYIRDGKTQQTKAISSQIYVYP